MILQLDANVHVVWSRPDSRIAPFCSVTMCLRHIPDDAVPLMMWRSDGACIHLCDECARKHVKAT